MSARASKYYAKGYDATFDKNRSLNYTLTGEQYGLERDLYALGVVMLEIMSLQNI